MNFNEVTTGMIIPLSRGFCENQNRIRKSWVAAISGTLFQARLETYPRLQRFALYAQIDEQIRTEYISRLRSHKNSLPPEMITERSIFGRHVLAKEAQIDVDEYLIDAMYHVVDELSKTIQMYEEPKEQ